MFGLGQGLTDDRCGEDDKWLVSYLIFKLQLIKGPCLIFVADIDRSYRLKVTTHSFSGLVRRANYRSSSLNNSALGVAS